VKALAWMGRRDVQVIEAPDPRIVNPRDAILRVTATAICGSDLHLYDGHVPSMREGDILGHEFMGEVVEVGTGVKNLVPGDRVVVPFAISCGGCFFCKHELWSLCDNSNPNAALLAAAHGQAGAGLFGYSHLYGGYAGGQAEYVRVPFADVGPLKVPPELSDEQVLLLSDVFPTGYMAAANCSLRAGDVVAVWGCGAVGQLAIRSAFLLGAERVIAIDRVPERLSLAATAGGADVVDFAHEDVSERLLDMTGGRGPDACIDAVGRESRGRGNALRQAIQSCRKGGIVSIPGAYGGRLDKVPLGAAFAKGLNLKMGQTHVHRYMPRLLEYVQRGSIDPSFVVTHRLRLDDGPIAYEAFAHKEDGCIKVVLRP
jgi:threonine dehydrogenase-like Zn-dependent dehydrogenase